MGKEMEQKGIIKSSFSWLSSRIKKVFGREDKEEKKINNLENIYDKFYKQEQLNSKRQETISQLNYKKKSELLQIVLRKLRNEENLHKKYQARKRKIQQYIETKTSQQKLNLLICPICMEFYINAVPTICGHTFCKKCLEEALLFKSGCPICRQVLRGNQIIPCHTVNNIVKMHVSKNSDHVQRQLYNQRLLQSQAWQKSKKIQLSDIQIGQRLDVRDTEFIWCIGSIDEVYKIGDQIKQILVHYLGWNKIYDEIIEINSPRLAPFSFYTSRNDINRYINNENDATYYSYVVTGAQFQQLQQMQQVDQLQQNAELQNQLIQQNDSQLLENNSNQNNSNEEQISENNEVYLHSQSLIHEEQVSNPTEPNFFNQVLRRDLNEIRLQQNLNNEQIGERSQQNYLYHDIQIQDNACNQENERFQVQLSNEVDEDLSEEQRQKKQ